MNFPPGFLLILLLTSVFILLLTDNRLKTGRTVMFQIVWRPEWDEMRNNTMCFFLKAMVVVCACRA